MSKSTIGLRRKGLAGLATATLTMGAVFAGAGIASADADFAFERVAGDNRYETSADIAAEYGASTDAILASGEDGRYPDALGANYLSGIRKAPVLLTETEELPAEVLAQLKANGVDNVTIVGGLLAVSQAVEDKLEAEGFTVNRIAGGNRFETNEAIVEAGPATAPSDIALVTTGLNFPDALSAGPLAYKGGHPVGLSNGADMPDDTIDALKAAGVDQALVVGGPLAVPESVITELEAKGIDVLQRLARTTAGQTNRSGTAAAVAEYAVDNLGFSVEGVNVASGRAFGDGADALAGGPLTGMQNRPLLITENESVAGSATLQYLREHAQTLSDGIIFGGPLAITPALEAEMEAAARSVTTNQDYTVGDGTAATNTVSSSGTDSSGARQYSVSGLDATKSYDVALFPAENVKTDANGVVSFDPNTQVADNSGVSIEVVNGVANVAAAETAPGVYTGDAHVNNVGANNGTINFTIDSVVQDSVVPVVFLDADNDNTVDLDANKQPTEEFGVGGKKTWNPAAATTGELGAVDEVITSVDKAANTIVTTRATYKYDENDTFYVVTGEAATADDAATPATNEAVTADCDNPANQATFAEFEAQLSKNDQLDESTFYQANSALPSTFCLEDQAPSAPSASTTAALTKDTTVAFTVTGITAGDTVTVYGGPDDNDAFSKSEDVQRGQTTTDQDPDTAGFQVIATGLTPSTAYDFFVTRTVDGEESAPSTKVDVTTDAPADPAIITNAELVTDGPIVDRVGTTDEWLLAFDQDLTAGSVANAEIDLTDPDGDTIRVKCAAAAPTDFLTGATCTLVDGPDADADADDALRIVLLENAEDRNAGGDAGTTGGGVEYPLTITAIRGLTDAQTENIDVANSTDKLIDDEA